MHIGIVACSAEGAALCYRTIAHEGAKHLGPHAHPRVTMDSISLAEYQVFIDREDWPQVGELMLRSAHTLAQAGADFLICPDNTIHQGLPFIEQRSPLPWLHIAAVVADEARRRGFHRIGLLGNSPPAASTTSAPAKPTAKPSAAASWKSSSTASSPPNPSRPTSRSSPASKNKAATPSS